MAIKAGDTLPADVKLMEMGDARPEASDGRRAHEGEDGRVLRRSRCLHAHLLDEAPAGLRREGRRHPQEGRGRDRLSVGERRFRHGRVGQGAGRRRARSAWSPTATASFTRAVGLEMDASGFGMGSRSKRYAMIVKDGKVTELLVEPAGGLNVSSAESVLGKLG